MFSGLDCELSFKGDSLLGRYPHIDEAGPHPRTEHLLCVPDPCGLFTFGLHLYRAAKPVKFIHLEEFLFHLDRFLVVSNFV